MKKFSKRVQQLRMEKGLTQEDLARALMINNTTVSSYERGVRMPSFEVLDNMAEYFDTSLDYLLGSSDVRRQYPRHSTKDNDRISPDQITTTVSIEEMELVKAYRGLDEHDRKLVRMAARLEV